MENQKNKAKKRVWIIYSFLIAVGILVLFYLINFLSENKVDPFWNKLDTILICNGITEGYDKQIIKASEKKADLYKIMVFENNPDSLEKRYNEFHSNNRKVLQIIPYISEPFIPTWNLNKINLIYDTLAKSKKFIINGVTGSGKSTLVNNAAKLIAGNPDRIFKLQCVQKMEIEYHKRWIGEYENDDFIPGKLLKIFDLAEKNPENNYVLILDDLDKIPPATFFGSEIWTELNNEDETTFIEGYDKEINFPDNFYLISVTHQSASSVYYFSDEQKRRLGFFYDLQPNYEELMLYSRSKIEKYELSTSHIKKLIYTFVKINAFIYSENIYGPGLTLGQWSTLRKNIKPEEFNEFIKIFLDHINSFNPDRKLLISDVNHIFKTIKNNGKIPNSNLFYKGYEKLLETGVFAELTVAVLFAVFSGLYGWFFIFKKRFLIKKIQEKLFEISKDYTSKGGNYEDTLNKMLEIKKEISDLVQSKQIKHDEAVYLMLYIEDQIKKIDKLHSVNDTTKEFQEQFSEIMTDGKIDDNEYKLILSFLSSLKPTLDKDIYYELLNEINYLYKKTKKN